MTRKVTRLFRILTLLSIAGFGGFAAASEIKLADDKDQIARIGIGGEPREIDPGKATGSPESAVITNLFQGLTKYLTYEHDIVPGVAESWDVSKDGLKYTFKIRKEAKWSDGTALTAHDFVYAWQRVLDPKTASEYAYMLYHLKNGEEINQGKKKLEELGAKAKDDHTLEVQLKGPTPFFLKLVAFKTYYPVPEKVIKKHEDNWTRAENIISNGPYQLKEWALNKHLHIVKNPHYWNKNNVTIQEAFLLPIEDTSTEEKTFLAGQLHKTDTLPAIKIPSYLKEAASNPKKYSPYYVHTLLGTYFYRINTTHKPLTDKRVRRALGLAIDRSLLTERIMQGGQQPGFSITPPDTAGYTPERAFADTLTNEALEEAKKLMAEAGYPEGKGFPKIDILYNTSENHKKMALALQSMWKKHLGIDVGIVNQEWKVYLNSVQKLDYHIARAGWIGDYPDPNTFLDMWLKDSGLNNTGWGNEKYDGLINKAAMEADQSKRFEIFKEAESLLMDELPIIPIYFYTQPKLVSEKLVMYDKNGTLRPFKGNSQDNLYLEGMAIAK